jgi:hypothetical protein
MEQINGIDEYLEKLGRYSIYEDVFYRGQLEKYPSISSSISRDVGFIKNEAYIYCEAIEMELDEFKDLKDPIEKLAKMQHYGIPTRLIDLTIDPLIALFFAVQNISDESPSNVHVFIQPKKSLNDKRVKLLALLATLNSYEIDSIKAEYTECYSEGITNEEVLEFVSTGAFIEHSECLQKYNKRLYCQKGTFAICGNRIEDKKILKAVLALDAIKPSMTMRIPFEQKYAVKQELNDKYNINETTIYPEFPSVSGFLKEKYRDKKFNSDGAYTIFDVKDISHVGAKRVSVVAVLNKIMRIEEVKCVGEIIIDQYIGKYDVVWLNLAKNGDDYITSNWIIRGQWIRESLDSKFKPFAIGESNSEGYIWKVGSSYSTLSDYYSEYTFKDDKMLYIQNVRTLAEFERYYYDMVNAFGKDDFKLLVNLSTEYASEITTIFMKFGGYGRSKTIEFDRYLDNFQELALHLDNIVLWLKRDDLSPRDKEYQITICFKDAKKHFDKIQKKAMFWKEKIRLSDDEFENFDLGKIEKKKYQFEPTIPLSPNAIEVSFDLDITMNTSNAISVSGLTNLFDRASLMLSIRNSKGLLLGQSKSEVENGSFNFGPFTRNGFRYEIGNYQAEITLAIPSVQNKEFTAQAGIEYENLKGDCVVRDGIAPM